MEAIGAAAAVVAIAELAAKVSTSAASLIRDIRGARKDMIQISKELSDLSTVLRMVGKDLEIDRSPSGETPPSQQHIVDIAHSCRAALMDIETVLRDSRSRLGWVASGKERVGGLMTRLDRCKSSLDVALDYRTM